MKKAEAHFGSAKYPKDHSDKHCCCGDYNHSNPKKNLNHHSTKAKLNIKKQRKVITAIENSICDSVLPI